MVIWVCECALAERLDSELSKYVAKGTESDVKDSRKLIYGIINCNELNRGENYSITIFTSLFSLKN